MDHIRSLLNKRVRQSGLAKQVGQALVIEYFGDLIKETMGYEVSKRVKPVYLKNNTIYLACVSSVVKQEIILHKSGLLESVCRKFGEGVITGIKFI